MPDTLLGKWQLEAKGAHGEPWITPITSSPFRIGRRNDCALQLPSESISRLHAEIRLNEMGILIKDCGSTNGTFVNCHRLTGEQALKPGDVVHFAGFEFQVGQDESIKEHSDRTVMINPYVERLDQLIANRAVIPYFQPIVRLQDAGIIGFELLGRVACEGLPSDAPELFLIAKQLGRDVELSLLFRDAGIAQIAESAAGGLIFFNTVPNEMELSVLGRSLQTLRQTVPHLHLTMEINEQTITNIGTIRELKVVLQSLDIKLVYDDFGAGQSRLLELMDAPPDILKFDISLVRNLDQRSPASLRMVAALVGMTKDLGVLALAEGIETAKEAAACRQIGFDLAQGYYFGRPVTNPADFSRPQFPLTETPGRNDARPWWKHK
jgi:EAL domain-containing protein (putative c-di-GMP-specific phosphodiesterase class I)